MTTFRSLALILVFIIPAWASYTLLPSDPGNVITRSTNSDSTFEQNPPLESTNQHLAIGGSGCVNDLETLMEAVIRLNAEVVSLKKQIQNLSIKSVPNFFQKEPNRKTAEKGIPPSIEFLAMKG